MGTIGALWRRRFHWARVLAVGQVTLILDGLGAVAVSFLDTAGHLDRAGSGAIERPSPSAVGNRSRFVDSRTIVSVSVSRFQKRTGIQSDR